MVTDLNPHIDAFLRHLQNERRLSLHTLAGYKRDLAKLQVFIAGLNNNDLLGLKPAEARLFPVQLHHHGLAGRSIQRVLSAVRSLYRYLMRENLAKGDHIQTSGDDAREGLSAVISVKVPDP